MDKVSYVSLWEETTAQRRARTNLIDIAAQQLGILLSLCKIARAHFLNLIFFFFEQ